MSIGKNIRKLRMNHNMTQQELAEKLGLSSMSVSQWENDRAVPRMGVVEDLSRVFKVPVSRIIEDLDEERNILNNLNATEYNAVGTHGNSEKKPGLQLDVVELVNAYDKLSDRSKCELTSYIAYLIYKEDVMGADY